VGVHNRRADRGEQAHAAGALRALALANARFWPTVAPAVRGELRRWQRPAAAIADPALRALALEKLADERFNAEVAATLATLAPAPRRPAAVRAIVALELLFDYLDGRTEGIAEDPIGQGERLFAPFIDAVMRGHATGADAGQPADWGYLTALSERTRDGLFALSAADAVGEVAGACARRCAQAQTRIHAAATLGEQQLAEWAVAHAAGDGLAWREHSAGCASSVLSIHALIAAAADPATTVGDAERIDHAYLAICAVITILDSIVDRAEDRARGQRGFIDLYEDGELALRLPALVREALKRARDAPHGEHHAMTLAGIVAYYTTHPGARDPAVRDVVLAVRRELSPTIWPALAVMRGWRAAKRARATLRRARLNDGGRDGEVRGEHAHRRASDASGAEEA